jgi:ankyrin repeat protein
LEPVTPLLSRPELDINAQNLNGNTALLIAASITVKSLRPEGRVFNALFHHPDVNREHKNKLGQTILVRAIKEDSRIIQTIIEGTRLSHQFNEIDDDGETLLSLAAEPE